MEQQIQAELKKQGLYSESDLKQHELAAASNVDPATLKQRYEEIAKMKSLLFRQEIKNRRVSKIKAKLYRKIKKRD